MEEIFDVFVGAYGNFPQYTLRCIDSIIQNAANRLTFQLHVGCSACGQETIQGLRERYDNAMIDTLVETRHNINKDPIMRLLIDRTTAPFFLWCDDDSHVQQGWDTHVAAMIQQGEPFDCAGHVFYCHRSAEYKNFLVKRPWWIGEEAYLEPDHRQRVWFATGGLFLARTEFMRFHNFPDKAMKKKQDDLLLGDLISQRGGRLINFSRKLMDLIKISDGERRGDGESNDGWLDVDPITGG